MSVKVDLIAAKSVIDTPEKWRKGLPDLTPMCAGEALSAMMEFRPSDEMSERKRQLISALGFDDLEFLVQYNDRPDTTHEDIMALFDRAIAASE